MVVTEIITVVPLVRVGKVVVLMPLLVEVLAQQIQVAVLVVTV